MRMPEWCDEYEIKARYIPVLLSVMPVAHLLLQLFGGAFLKELAIGINWIPAASNLSLSFVGTVALAQFQCSLGKHWIEEGVFGKGGERFPTTDMLLYENGMISRERKAQIRAIVSELCGCALSDECEENTDPENARLRAREAVGQVRATVSRGVMTITYNIRYGFFRNLIAGVIWSVIGSVGCSIYYGSVGNWKVMGLFIVLAAGHLALFIFRKSILDNLASAYADTLFSEFINQTRGV